jgi:hypothetical protein
MISGSLCRHLKIAGRFVIEVSSPYQSPAASTLQHILLKPQYRQRLEWKWTKPCQRISPPHVVNVELESAVDVICTSDGGKKESAQILPQLITDGDPAIVPVPAPDLITFKVTRPQVRATEKGANATDRETLNLEPLGCPLTVSERANNA